MVRLQACLHILLMYLAACLQILFIIWQIGPGLLETALGGDDLSVKSQQRSECSPPITARLQQGFGPG